MAAAGALGCGEADEMESGIPPWHMWGNSLVIGPAVAGGGAAASQAVQQQLIRVGYRRPETWHWVFGAKLLAGPNLPLLGNQATVLVLFDLTLGIGRSNILIPGFESYLFAWSGPANAPIGELKYSTQVFGPNRIDNPVASEIRDNTIAEVVSQDIQLGCRVIHQSTTAGSTATVEVHAQFAPKTHVRPEWYRTPARFPGAEG